MKKGLRGIITVISTAVLSVFCMLPAAFPSFASDYDIYDCWWEDNQGSNAIAAWEKPEGKTSYKVQLYKGSKVVQKWKTVGSSRTDYTSVIVKNGTGEYTFKVYSEKGGTETTVTSDVLDVDSDIIADLKATVKEEKQKAAMDNASDGWHSYPGNEWTFGKGNYTLCKNEWRDINGSTYYFGSDNLMAKGWKKISNKWYYFDTTNGYLYRNTTTPDGYYVNADGVWTDQSSSGHPAGTGKNTSSVTVNIKESGKPGAIQNAEVTGVSNANLVSYSFATPQSQWSIGSTVKLTVIVEPRDGFQFSSSTSVKTSRGKIESRNGNSPMIITIYYTPSMKLEAPKNLYFGDDGCVKWTKVDHAKSYKVRVYDGTSLKKTQEVETTYYDLNDYSDSYDYENINVAVTAVGKNSYYQESDAAKLGNLSEYLIEGTGVGGEFTRNSQGLFYRDETGEKVRGWQQINGTWYYFDSNGYAKKDWFQDTDGNWYYFDSENKMVTGNVPWNGTQCFMNDGSNASFPYGAWVH